jgi:hypothetical protein
VPGNFDYPAIIAVTLLSPISAGRGEAAALIAAEGGPSAGHSALVGRMVGVGPRLAMG